MTFKLVNLLAVALALAACSGGTTDREAGPSLRKPTAATTDVRVESSDTATLRTSVVRVAAEARPRVPARSYATADEALAIARDAPRRAIEVDVACCDDVDADLAVFTAYGLQAGWNLPDDAPVLVRGDLAMAESVADRLTRAGFERVWVVYASSSDSRPAAPDVPAPAAAEPAPAEAAAPQELDPWPSRLHP
jgi:hypothetical protein